uniref:Gag-Pol polyprotein n=1 Tax=Tanacetum cinerariifolium TaxID=118510 RepID=A0A6L2MCU0_TANCI|nr:hypothetical protein [Tanacetum cinerariifolium]
MQTQTSNTLHNAIMKDGSKDRPSMLAPEIRDQLNAEAEAIQIILTGIDNDIYSTVDACPNACEMWKGIKRLKQGESINVQYLETNLYWEFGKFTSQDDESLESYYSRFYKMMNELIRNPCKSQELKTASYHKLYDILKQHQHEVNEIRAERIAYVANPLALVAQQQPVYHPQTHPTHYTQNSSTRSQQADDETSKDKEIDKLMALITLLFKKIYKPTNNNLQTSSNTSRANQDNSPRTNKSAGYENQRTGNVAEARETVGLTVVQKSRIQCYNCKEFRHVAKEYQELEAHYMYMAQLQEVFPDAADSRPIFDDEPLQNVSNDDHYNMFAMESEHPEQLKYVHDTYPIEQDAQNVIIDSLDMSYDREEINQNDDDNDFANEQKIANRTYSGNIDPFIQKTIEANFSPVISRINAGLEQFHRCLNEEMVADLRYFNSLKLEVDSLRSQLEIQKTQFLNEIDRLSREYYYADHMNAILGVYTELDEVTNLQCDYLKLLEKCEGFETELSKSKMMSKVFESVQKHAINLELELQQCKENIKNDTLFTVIQTNDFCKEREQYFEIQDLKAQLQDKGIVTSELKKLIEKLKGKSVVTKFEKSSVIQH